MYPTIDPGSQHVALPLVPLCRGEAGLLVTPKYGYFRNLLPLVSVVDLSLHLSSFSAFLACIHLICENNSTQSRPQHMDDAESPIFIYELFENVAE